jgi:hypothetical protein
VLAARKNAIEGLCIVQNAATQADPRGPVGDSPSLVSQLVEQAKFGWSCARDMIEQDTALGLKLADHLVLDAVAALVLPFVALVSDLTAGLRNLWDTAFSQDTYRLTLIGPPPAKVIPVDVQGAPLAATAIQIVTQVLDAAERRDSAALDQLIGAAGSGLQAQAQLDQTLAQPGAFDEIVKLLTQTHGEPTDGYTWPGFTLDKPGDPLTPNQQSDLRVMGVSDPGLYGGLRVLIHRSYPAGQWSFAGVLTTAARQAASPATVAPFVGHWFQHGGDLNVHSDGTVDLTYQNLPANSPGVKLRIISVQGSVADATVTMSDDPSMPNGASISFTRQEPGIVMSGAGSQGPAPNWCDTAHAAQGACGS